VGNPIVYGTTPERAPPVPDGQQATESGPSRHMLSMCSVPDQRTLQVDSIQTDSAQFGFSRTNGYRNLNLPRHTHINSVTTGGPSALEGEGNCSDRIKPLAVALFPESRCRRHRILLWYTNSIPESQDACILPIGSSSSAGCCFPLTGSWRYYPKALRLCHRRRWCYWLGCGQPS
jgi:hypothetical protein